MLTNPFDAPEAVRAREQQADPLVMYLVVRRERVTSAARLFAAVAAAAIGADRAYRADPRYAALVAAWHAGSFRKIAVRANEKDWARLLEREELVLGADPLDGEPLVAALPVRARSEQGSFMRGLQAYSADLGSLEGAPWTAPGVAAVIALNPLVSMSGGKAVAQVGHVALMAADAVENLGGDAAWAAALDDWATAGWPVELAPASPAGWSRALADEPCVVVTDSGLTELVPGSRTVLLLRPAGPAERQAAAARLEA